jgi:hypothetical protein
MGKFVEIIRKKLGLEPERKLTVTGNIPNKVVVNRNVMREQGGYPVPVIPTVGARDKQGKKTSLAPDVPAHLVSPDEAGDVGLDSSLINGKNVELERRKTMKRLYHNGMLEGIDEPKPMGSVGTFTTTPVPSPVLKSKKVKSEGLFAADIASGDTGEAGNPNQSMDQLNGPTHPIDPKFIKKKIVKEEVGLVEYVQSIISEAKNIDIWHAGNHWDPEARHHARKYKEHNKDMSDIVSDRTRNRPEEYAKHAEQAMMHHRKFKERLAQLNAGKKEDLQENKSRGKDSKGHFRSTEAGAGMTKKGVEAYRRQNPGSKLSTAVTTPPSKLKPGSKAANRRKSFCARMGGMPGPMKDEKGRPTRKAMSLRRWNCEASEILKTLVEAKKMKGKDPCWKDYEMVGTKKKNGREVPNCVPVDEMSVPLGTTGKRADWNPPMVGIRMASGKIEKHPPGKSGSSGGGNGGDE